MQIFVVFSPDNFLTRTLSSEEGGVSRLVLRLMSAAENLPSHAAEMMRNALPDQLLQLQHYTNIAAWHAPSNWALISSPALSP